jgi:hypothetical protein
MIRVRRVVFDREPLQTGFPVNPRVGVSGSVRSFERSISAKSCVPARWSMIAATSGLPPIGPSAMNELNKRAVATRLPVPPRSTTRTSALSAFESGKMTAGGGRTASVPSADAEMPAK